ncbi:MAG TPA: hypothetical protein VIP05_26945 [Burkholderiaceae bacterium]
MSGFVEFILRLLASAVVGAIVGAVAWSGLSRLGWPVPAAKLAAVGLGVVAAALVLVFVRWRPGRSRRADSGWASSASGFDLSDAADLAGGVIDIASDVADLS